MAIPISIQAILDGSVVEDERVELKETWDPQASLKTICAFANDLNNWGGGYIVIGVRETPNGKKDLLGAPDSRIDTWMKDILNKCKLIQPDYMPISEVVTHKNKHFIVLWCPGGSVRPYSSPRSMGKKSERVRWVRRLSSTVAPSNEEERELYTLSNNVPFDDRPNHEADLSDLSPILVKAYLKAVGSSLFEEMDGMAFEEVCRSMHIATGPSEYIKPLNVGLLFFSTDPSRFFPYSQIDVVEFPDGEGGDTLVEHSFTGPLNQQLEDALRYLTNNVVEEIVVKQANGSPSKRSFNYPPEALKEALANAVYHKGYDSREPIEVRVVPGKIEILSHPGADRSISLQGLKDYRMACRRYRNRRIGEFLKELGLTEGRNTGIHKILRALRQNGSPDPLFETDEERLYFMVTLYERHKSERLQNDASPSTRTNTLQRQTERRNAVLAYLEKNPGAPVVEASGALAIPSATLNRDIAVLRSEGRLSGNSRKGWQIEEK